MGSCYENMTVEMISRNHRHIIMPMVETKDEQFGRKFNTKTDSIYVDRGSSSYQAKYVLPYHYCKAGKSCSVDHSFE